MNITTKWLRTFALGGLASLALATTATQLSAAEPIKIGMITPLSGGGGAYGAKMAKAAQAAAKTINDAGGILGGRMLEIIVEDSETNATAAVRAARKLIDVNKVTAIAGMWGSGPTLAVKPIAIDKGVALISNGAADAITAGAHNGLVWRYQAPGSEWGVPAAKAMMQAGHKKIAVLGLQNPFTGSMVKPFIAEVKRGGGQIVANIEFKPDQASFKAEVEKVFSKEPDAVFVPAYVNQFTSISKDVYRSGYDSQLYTLTIAASAGKNGGGKFIKAVGKGVAEGIHHVQPTSPSDRAEYKAFVKLMGAPDGTFFPFAALVYDQVTMLALAMEKSATTDARVYVKAIAGIASGPGAKVGDPVAALKMIRANKDFDYTGAGMDLEFKANGDLKDRPFTHFMIKDGKDTEVGVIK